MQNKTKNQKNTILVAMGGNLASKIGPPHVTLGYALASLRLMTNSLLQKSKYFVTPCFPIGYGPDYVNAAVSFQFLGQFRSAKNPKMGWSGFGSGFTGLWR
jgi:2-amino-4-hydroxy-6-hydroxymethyldihydropteridine diphosphokinase